MSWGDTGIDWRIRLKRWLSWNVCYLILGMLLAALIMVVWVGVSAGLHDRQVFLEECLQDRKPYECTAMWRGGN